MFNLLPMLFKGVLGFFKDRIKERSTSAGIALVTIGIGLYSTDSTQNVWLPLLLIIAGILAILIKSSKWGAITEPNRGKTNDN